MKGVKELQRKAASQSWAKRAAGIAIKAHFCPAQKSFWEMGASVRQSKYFKGDTRKVDRARRPSALERLLVRKQKKV